MNRSFLGGRFFLFSDRRAAIKLKIRCRPSDPYKRTHQFDVTPNTGKDFGIAFTGMVDDSVLCIETCEPKDW